MAVRDLMIEDGCSRGYINKLVARIKRCFRWGVSQELVPPHVHQGLSCVDGLRREKTTARETPPVLPVPDDDVERTLRVLKHPTIRDMIRFQRLTGCRPGELFIMGAVDIDRSGKVWIYTPSSHKMEHFGTRRAIAIGPGLSRYSNPT